MNEKKKTLMWAEDQPLIYWLVLGFCLEFVIYLLKMEDEVWKSGNRWEFGMMNQKYGL
jgi:hypothetical protein